MRSVTRLVVLACIALLGATGSAWATWDVPPKPIPPERAIPTLETSLQLLAEQVQASPERAGELALSLGVELVVGRITVVVEGTGLAHGQVAALGGEITHAAEIFGLWEVAIPPSQLPALARLPGVRFVRRPHQPIPAGIVSEGVSRTRAPNWHAGGFLGQGVRVAVIDLDFKGVRAAIAAGELRRVVSMRDYTGTGMEGDDPHGTACAEIVQDMAPQAELILMKVGNGVQLARAVEDAVALGARVISHSAGWMNTNFYDGTGEVCDIARWATERGVLWVNAAGNSAAPGATHWEGDWSDPDGDGVLNFAGADEVNNFTLEAGAEMTLWLTWDDWPLSSQDYDFYITDAAGNLVAGSRNRQTGTQPPTELIHFRAPTSGRYGIIIHAYNAPRRPRLELFGFPWEGASLEYSTSRSSIPAPGNASFVLTVGAIGWRNWTAGPQQPYSSQGPSNSSRLNPVSITKPDISGPDEVSTMGYGREGYPGTSAAAPHVAGAAAVVWSANPGWTASQVRAWLERNAVDMGTRGKDNLFGFGRLDLPAPVADVPPPGTSHTYGGVAGWYMVSVPTTGDVAGIFDVTLWNWDGTRFVAATTLNPNMGYWARLPADKTVTATGAVPTTDQTRTLTRTGWHMVSAPWTYPKTAIMVVRGAETKSWTAAVTAGWVQDRVWDWRTAEARYAEATTFQPWFGYWLRARVDGLSLRFLHASRVTTLGASDLMLGPKSLVPGEMPPPPPTETLGAGSIQFRNTPNPITDVHTTTFQVLGPATAGLVTEIRVVIFDLSGRLVWQGSAAGAELAWHTDDLSGRYLANGIYLYQITAKVAGTRVSSGMLKLAIYR